LQRLSLIAPHPRGPLLRRRLPVRRRLALLAATLLILVVPAAAAVAGSSVGPDQGSLVIVGGGAVGPEIVARFVALAGGPESELLCVPTASETEQVDTKRAGDRFARLFGVKNVTVLHTRDRAEADTEEFVAP